MGVNTFFTKGMMNTFAEHYIKMSFGLDDSQTIWLTVSHESMYKYMILIAHFLRLKMPNGTFYFQRPRCEADIWEITQTCFYK